MSRDGAPSVYAVVSDISAVLTSSLVLEEVLGAVAQRIAEVMGVWGCYIDVYDAQQNTLTCVAYWAIAPSADDLEYIGTVIRVSERPGFDPIIKGRKVIETRLDDPDLDPSERLIMEEWNEQSVLEAPLLFGDEVIGVLGLVETREVRHFTDEEKELFAGLAMPAAIAIHNAQMYRRQEEQNRRLASLLESSRAMSSTFVLEEVLDLVARKTGEAVDSDECFIFEYAREHDAIVFRSAYARDGEPTEDDVGTMYPLDDYPEDRELLARGEIVEERISDPDLGPGSRASMAKWGEKTCLNVPLIFNEEPVGILCLVETRRERRFSDAEIELVRGLGEQAAAAIQNAKLYRRGEVRNQRLVNLLETSRLMTASLDLGSVLERVELEVGALLLEKQATIEVRLRDEEGAFRSFREALEAAPTAVAGPTCEPDELARLAVRESRPAQGAGEETGRLVVPLVVRDTVEGYIDISLEQGLRFGDDEVEPVQILANQAAVALENARLYQTIELQAVTDGLTGLFNHRYFYQRLQQEVKASTRYGAPLSMLMIDIDDFKLYNDEFGHQAGDQVLREVADILRRQLRRNIDLPARYGGEEFAVLLPNTPIEGAQAVSDRLMRQLTYVGEDGVIAVRCADDPLASAAEPPAAAAAEPSTEAAKAVGERIRRDVEETRFMGHAGKRYARVTISVGVATFPTHANDGEGLVRAADKALYVAKRMGKNRVELFG